MTRLSRLLPLGETIAHRRPKGSLGGQFAETAEWTLWTPSLGALRLEQIGLFILISIGAGPVLGELGEGKNIGPALSLGWRVGPKLIAVEQKWPSGAQCSVAPWPASGELGRVASLETWPDDKGASLAVVGL